MATRVQIAKLALQQIGDRFDVSDLNEQSPEAEQINLIYEDTRKELMRSHPWRFANKFVTPATLNVTVPANWDYAYQYPSDCLRIIEIVNPLGRGLENLKFDVSLLADNTKVILTDEGEATFRYTADITDPTRFDSEFVNAFAHFLAYRACMGITGDVQLTDFLMKGANAAIMKAAATDSNEGYTDEFPDATWITARN